MAKPVHPEEALFQAGASDGYYEIVGASYAPGSNPGSGVATILLSTVDQTGCLLKHDYGTGETTLKWDSDFGENLMGSADDVQTAIEDITHGAMGHRALFAAFQSHMSLGNSGTPKRP